MATANRKKKLRKEIRSKYRVPRQSIDIHKIEYKNVALRYARKIDEFSILLQARVNGNINMNIVGIIDCTRFYGDNKCIKITTPMGARSDEYFQENNCYYLELTQKNAPKLFSVVVGYVHNTGDYFDIDKYEEEKHGPVTIYNNGSWILDNDITPYIKWDHTYSEQIEKQEEKIMNKMKISHGLSNYIQDTTLTKILLDIDNSDINPMLWKEICELVTIHHLGYEKIIARLYLDGYELISEKMYAVKVPELKRRGKPLYLCREQDSTDIFASAIKPGRFFLFMDYEIPEFYKEYKQEVNMDANGRYMVDGMQVHYS